MGGDLRCASFSSLPIVPAMPRPISAARRANSDRRGCASPFASAFCASVRRDRRCAPTLFFACRRCACARTDWNSAVRSCIEVTAIVIVWFVLGEKACRLEIEVSSRDG